MNETQANRIAGAGRCFNGTPLMHQFLLTARLPLWTRGTLMWIERDSDSAAENTFDMKSRTYFDRSEWTARFRAEISQEDVNLSNYLQNLDIDCSSKKKLPQDCQINPFMRRRRSNHSRR
ncbi:hypothetical protein NQ318_006041 [Aromia moschata]|uniref:Uncharacterized protein n=1 Tax=Aromia moschata TaxID=1265417 RepID=A0AAV8Z1S1_9CUCU|nr:hypothetical protein NQ318_006041 [Aromia moschata]